MAEKDVDEQFAAIMSHWDEEALGLDPFGDPTAAGGHDDPDSGEAAGGDTAKPAAAGSTVAEVAPTPPEVVTPIVRPSVGPRPDSPDTVAIEPGEADEDDDARPASSWRQHTPPEVEEHFEPPPPAPLPSADDKHFWTMLAALIGGPVVFLYLLLFNRDGNGWWMTFALMVSVAGFVLLVLRQPNERDEDDHGIRL